MEKYILYFYILLFMFLATIKAYWNYRKAQKSGDILFSKWAMPISKWDFIMYIIMIYIIGDTIGNKLNRGYFFVIMYALSIIVMNILHAKLLITDRGIYFMSQFTRWDNVNEIILVNKSVINVRRHTFLSSGYKIRNFSYDESFISIIEDKCVVEK